MAIDKTVDSAALDADLTSIADAIRAKGGTSETMTFPSGFVSAINAISAGASIQTTSGQTTFGSNGAVSFDCGIVPDVLILASNAEYTATLTAYPFTECGTSLRGLAWYGDQLLFDNRLNRNGTAISGSSQAFTSSWANNTVYIKGSKLYWKAIKYTA